MIPAPAPWLGSHQLAWLSEQQIGEIFSINLRPVPGHGPARTDGRGDGLTPHAEASARNEHAPRDLNPARHKMNGPARHGPWLADTLPRVLVCSPLCQLHHSNAMPSTDLSQNDINNIRTKALASVSHAASQGHLSPADSTHQVGVMRAP